MTLNPNHLIINRTREEYKCVWYASLSNRLELDSALARYWGPLKAGLGQT